MNEHSELDAAWQALLAAAAGDEPRASALGLRLDSASGWIADQAHDRVSADLLALYLPFIQPLRATAGCSRAFGHLGQSLDGCVATDTGDACFVTGEANIVHLHRMRALADAVIIGAGTVANDDPLLTTRLVPGPHAVRVVIDPDARLSSGYRLFRDDTCPTLVCSRTSRAGLPAPAGAERLSVPDRSTSDDRHTGTRPSNSSSENPEPEHPGSEVCSLDLSALCAQLRERGLRRLFIEGGGVTVSRFLRAGLLERLQIAVAPVVIGRGRPGVSVPSVARLSQAVRPASRVFRMGTDMLYDLCLTADPEPGETRDQTLALVR